MSNPETKLTEFNLTSNIHISGPINGDTRNINDDITGYQPKGFGYNLSATYTKPFAIDLFGSPSEFKFVASCGVGQQRSQEGMEGIDADSSIVCLVTKVSGEVLLSDRASLLLGTGRDFADGLNDQSLYMLYGNQNVPWSRFDILEAGLTLNGDVVTSVLLSIGAPPDTISIEEGLTYSLNLNFTWGEDISLALYTQWTPQESTYGVNFEINNLGPLGFFLSAISIDNGKGHAKRTIQGGLNASWGDFSMSAVSGYDLEIGATDEETGATQPENNTVYAAFTPSIQFGPINIGTTILYANGEEGSLRAILTLGGEFTEVFGTPAEETAETAE